MAGHEAHCSQTGEQVKTFLDCLIKWQNIWILCFPTSLTAFVDGFWTVQVLGTLSEYPVAKEICIATDKPSRLAMEIGRWEMPDVGVCSNITELAGLDRSATQLVSIHRHHLYAALKTGKLSTS